MVVGFLILAAMAIIEWVLNPESIGRRASIAGWLQIGLPFMDGPAVSASLLTDTLPLIMRTTPGRRPPWVDHFVFGAVVLGVTGFLCSLLADQTPVIRLPRRCSTPTSSPRSPYTASAVASKPRSADLSVVPYQLALRLVWCAIGLPRLRRRRERLPARYRSFCASVSTPRALDRILAQSRYLLPGLVCLRHINPPVANTRCYRWYGSHHHI